MAEQLYAILLQNAQGKKPNPKTKSYFNYSHRDPFPPKRVKIGNDIMMDEL